MKASDKLQSIKQEIEHLEVQLALGKAEAVEKFEEKKKKMKEATQTAKTELEKVEGKGKELAHSLRADIERLQVQLALGRMESLDKYHAFEQESKGTVEGLVTKANELQDLGEKKYDQVAGLLKTKALEFKGQMEAYRVQLALGEMEAKSEYEGRKEGFIKEAKSMSKTIDRALAEAEHKIEEAGDKLAKEFLELKRKFIG